jgi:hypothetical protein
MILWIWHDPEQQWKSQPLQPGNDYLLNEHARLWVVQTDVAILFAKPDVAVNGRAALPFQPLADRDEITSGIAHWCVSFVAQPERDAFRAFHQPIQCARCCGPFADGEPTIICPHCRARYHDHDTLRCWTYGPACSRCHRSTTEPQWEPAPLHRSTRRSRHNDASASR